MTNPEWKPQPGKPAMTQAAIDILSERQRQIEGEGWTPNHDDKYTHGELPYAAASYALQSCADFGMAWLHEIIARLWPWSKEWWKPSDRRRNLVKAGALIIAEIDRLDRNEGVVLNEQM